MQKNDEFELFIEDMGVDGAGIGHKDGITFFVKDAVVGDTVKAGVTKMKKSYGYARLISVVKPSEWRVAPPCPQARACGGCTIMALAYKEQLALKERQVENALRRIAGIPEAVLSEAARPIIGMEEPYRYRNKAQYPIGEDVDGSPVIGYYAAHSHRIVECEDCRIGQKTDGLVREIVKTYMSKNHVRAYDERTGRGLMRHLLIRYGLSTGEVMVCLVATDARLPKVDALLTELSAVQGMASICVNVNTRRDNVIMGEETYTLWGRSTIRETLNGVTYHVSAKSFFQVNPRQTEELYARAVSYAAPKGDEVVWDLYCGIGTMTLLLAKQAKRVYGVEVVPEAIADARENARQNGIENVRFIEGRAEDVLAPFAEGGRGTGEKEDFAEGARRTGEKEDFAGESGIEPPDVIVTDPPRKGCDEACLAAIIAVAPKRVVYVSCNPSTLARDLMTLLAGGYELREYVPVDQFGHSMHVETCALLTKTGEA